MRLGGCQCGVIRFSSEGDAGTLFIRHCRECQKQSASAFGISLQVPRSSLIILPGQPMVWSRTAESLRRLNCVLCSTCGSRLWHESSTTSEMVSIKSDCLDQPVDTSEAAHIWTTRRLPGISIPEGAKQFPGKSPE